MAKARPPRAATTENPGKLAPNEIPVANEPDLDPDLETEPEAPGRHRAPAAARRWIVSQAVRPSGMLKLRPDKGESGRYGGEAYPNLSGSF